MYFIALAKKAVSIIDQVNDIVYLAVKHLYSSHKSGKRRFKLLLSWDCAICFVSVLELAALNRGFCGLNQN